MKRIDPTLYFMFLNNPPTCALKNLLEQNFERQIRSEHTERRKMDDMSRLVLFIQTTRLLRIPVIAKSLIIMAKEVFFWKRVGAGTDLRSPSEELAKIQVSPGFLPNLEPSGSVLTIHSMPFPTKPVPPVTSTTSGIVDIDLIGHKVVGAKGKERIFVSICV